jgi:hypothetical protein
LSEIPSDSSGTFVASSVVYHATEGSELRNRHHVLNVRAVKCSSVTTTNDIASEVLGIQGVYLATLSKPDVSANLVLASSLIITVVIIII